MSKKLTVKVPTVYMDGGLIQGMEGFKPGTRLDVIDYDLGDMPDENELCNCKAGDGEHYHNKITIDKSGQF